MRSDVHFAALRAASKVAFSVVLLGGCSAAERSDNLLGQDKDETSGNGPESAESAVNAGGSKDREAKPAKGSRSYRTECHKDAGAPEDAAPPPPPNCEQVIAAAFPTEGDYPGTKQNVSSEVEACCAERLVETSGMMEHRWDCCANTGSETPSQDINLACTPWGPPVPPSMGRRREPSRDLAMGRRLRARPPHPDAWARSPFEEVA
jgi:hypothetical protein